MRAGEVWLRKDAQPERHVVVVSNDEYHEGVGRALVVPLAATEEGANPQRGGIHTITPFPAYLAFALLHSLPLAALSEHVGDVEPQSLQRCRRILQGALM